MLYMCGLSSLRCLGGILSYVVPHTRHGPGAGVAISSVCEVVCFVDEYDEKNVQSWKVH